MKRKYFIIFCFILTICICSACQNTQSTSGKEDIMITETFSAEATIFAPNDVTLEDMIKGANDLRDMINKSYSVMLEDATAQNAPKKGVKAADKVTQKYKSSIDELAALDFSSMSKDDILSYTAQMSNIFTAIREARDLLNK